MHPGYLLLLGFFLPSHKHSSPVKREENELGTEAANNNVTEDAIITGVGEKIIRYPGMKNWGKLRTAKKKQTACTSKLHPCLN